MNVLIIDTSVWIEFFRGKTYPDLELALKEARVFLSPIVAAELLSGVRTQREETELMFFLKELKEQTLPLTHWFRVGNLRWTLSKKGFNLSIPDAHIAQCTLDTDGYLMSNDQIFEKVSKWTGLKLLS